MSSNQKKITFVVTIGTMLIAAFLITSIISFRVSRSALRANITEHELPLTSDNIYSEIQHDLIRPVLVATLMANDTFVRDWITGGEKDKDAITRYLKSIEETCGAHSAFFVSEQTKIYYHSNGILKKVSPDEPRDKWYYRVREMFKPYEINMDPDLANRDLMTIFINHRVKDDDGNFLGAIGVGLTVRAVLDLIEIYQVKYDRAVYFFDKDGNVTMAGSKFDPAVAFISQPNLGSACEQVLEHGSDIALRYRADGHTINSNIRYIEEWGWFLAVEKAEDRTMQGIWHALLLSLVVCSVMTVAVTLLVNRAIDRYQRKIAALRGILPICSYCDKVRDEKGKWSKVESFVARHSEAEFSHSICPDCMQEHHPDVV